MQTITMTKRAALLLGMGFIASMVLVAAGTAWASHQFTDVADNHPHHAGISYVKDVGITAGCTQTTYCPEEFVKRSQMATFLHRASGNAPGIAPSVNAAELGGVSADVLQEAVRDLRADVSALQDKLQFVSIVGADTMRISGANLQIVSGSGVTYGDVNGLGNLIVGYNESLSSTRTGSHNLVLGPFHSYSSYGGIVSGYNNTISGQFASVTGGSGNTASVEYAIVTGGEGNAAGGVTSTVITGGKNNTATGGFTSVTGGFNNSAGGAYSVVSGGKDRSVTGFNDWRGGSYFSDF